MLDFLISLAGLILLSPVMLILTVTGAVRMKGNPFFTQERPGYRERIFRLIKFRTMTNEKDAEGNLLPDAQRLCGYGRFLRASSLDELPELFNILKGDMALVGPRPLLVKYLPRYSEEQRHRHDVRPGLTGYAQSHGRNAVTWEEKFEMDVWYTRHVSFPLDLRILLKTVGTVLRREGIHSGTSDTMEEFTGERNGGSMMEKAVKKLVILGASGHGKVVADIAVKNGYTDIVFLDDDPSLTTCAGYPVLGPISLLAETEGDVFAAIGNAGIRRKETERYPDRAFPTLIHPGAIIAPDVEIGSGSVVMAGAVINPGAVIGKGCIVNTCASVDHDCVLGDYCHVAPGAHLCGTVTVGAATWIGAGATVSNNLTICGGCMIGAGAVAVKDITVPGTYIGVPAGYRR